MNGMAYEKLEMLGNIVKYLKLCSGVDGLMFQRNVKVIIYEI